MNKIFISSIISLSLISIAPTQYTETFKLTAYCPCKKCCGKYADGFTATGKKAVQKAQIIAVDKKIIPLHSKIYIEDLGIFYAEDTGAAIKGNKIDVLFNKHQDALNFGVQYKDVKIIKRGR